MPDGLTPTSEPATKERGEYLVVARRYRPTTFRELIGQQHVAQALCNAIESGRVGHAYLFTGARGVGKTSAARILAKALNCQSGQAAEPCGKCDICLSIAAGEDVDVLEIDGASNRGIDEIRQLRQNAVVRPSRARFKIYIIDEVHMLTKEAFNALLKTLEEPPEHVKFIFATTEPNKIPITILSRCQRFDFAGIASSAIEERLRQIAQAEGIVAEDEAIRLIARRASGSMRDSQSLLEQLLSLGTETISPEDVNRLLGTAPAARLQSLVDALSRHDAAEMLKQFDAAVEQGTEPAHLIDQLVGYFRDVMAACVGCDGDLFLNVTPGQQESVAEIGRSLGIETILAIIQILERSASQMRASTHSRTLAEIALVRIAKLEELDQLSEMISALQSGKKSDSSPAGPPKKKPPVVASPASAASALRTSPKPVAEVSSAISYQSALTDETVGAIWKHVVDNLGEIVADQAALCDSVAISAPNRLAVRFPAKYTSCSSFCERAEQKAKLEQALTIASGHPISIRFEVLDARVDEAHPPASRNVSSRQYQTDVLSRPMVQRAIELFEVENPRVEPPDIKAQG